jgi:hypothetical protein
MPEPLLARGAGESVEVLGLRFEVIEVPGHTAGHIAYYAAALDGAPLLFCGDTLFSGGCGRLFEGTPAQMLDSLTRLAALPANTRVCCTHEYTLVQSALRQAVEPGNADLAAYPLRCQAQRAQNFPTLPSSIGLEKQINPFLRTGETAVVRTAQAHRAGPTHRCRDGLRHASRMEKRFQMTPAFLPATRLCSPSTGRRLADARRHGPGAAGVRLRHHPASRPRHRHRRAPHATPPVRRHTAPRLPSYRLPSDMCP